MKKLVFILLAQFLIVTAEAQVTVAQARQFCQVWFPALVLGDRNLETAVTDLIKNFYTANAVMIDPNFTEPQVGRVKLAQYYHTILAKYPDWSFEIEDIFPTDKGFVLHYIGHVPGVVESFRGVDIIEIDQLKKDPRQWKISKLIGIYDRVPFRGDRE